MNNETLTLKIHKYKEDGFEYQKRRHEDWKENYQLYRDKVVINRLIQRQSVNIPLMKETIRTWLSNIDDAPDLVFEELGNDKQKEINLNEYWKYCAEKNKLEIKDIVDKKQVGLCGRSFKKLNIVDGEFYFEVLDPQDVLIDRYADPSDLDNTAMCIIHQHIFRSISDLENNPNYDKEVIQRLKLYYTTDKEGIRKSEENAQSLRDKNERLREMGDTNVDDPQVGEAYVELNENYVKLWDENEKKFVLNLTVTCNQEVLMSKPFKEVLNVDFFPILSWADDVEKTDIWSDGIADTIRTPNKILNSWFSQLVENRNLRNFGMNYYNSLMEGFSPQTFEPTPWGWVPIPGNPNENIMRIEIPELSESLDEMQFVIDMAGRSTAATNQLKGEQTKGDITLGEIQLITSKAMERITSTAKFYRNSWKEFGQKWAELVHANADKLNSVKLYKKSFKNNYFEKQVSSSDWKSEAGYRCIVRTSAEQEQESAQTLQKFNAVMAQFPDNQPLREIYQKKLLDFIGLSPEEVQEVVQFDKQKIGLNNELMPGMGAINMPAMANASPVPAPMQ